MEAKETIGDGGGPKVRALMVWELKHTVTSTVQAAKGWQRQLRLPTTPSGCTCMTACTLHKSPKSSSSLSRLTKKVTSALYGDEKSFYESAARKM